MKVHYLQHVPFEGLGAIEEALLQRGHGIKGTHLFAENVVLPLLEDVDFLIVMGGPMSVNDADQYPWLEREKEFIRQYIKKGKPVLGVCLGAQLIASALDAVVRTNYRKEIGWFEIEGTSSAGVSHFSFPEKINVFHWHGETFDLPPGGVRLASSAACENQAFQVGRVVIGLQFHLETTPQSAAEIVSHCRDELIADDSIQSEEEILAADPDSYASINGLMEDILDYLLAGTVEKQL